MKYDLLYNFISPITGRILSDPGYVPYGDRNGIATPSPVIKDIKLDLINLRGSPFVIGTPSPKLPGAQVLSYLDDGFMYNTGGVISTSGSIMPGSLNLPEGELFIGDSTGHAIPTQTITIDNLPALHGVTIPIIPGEFDVDVGEIWVGSHGGRPVASYSISTDLAYINARFLFGPIVLNGSINPLVQEFLIAGFPSGQILNIDIPEGGIAKVLPVTGKFALAIPDVDYATMAAMEEALAQAREAAAQAGESATAAAQSSAEALVSAEEAAASAAEALVDAGLAAASATAAAASAGLAAGYAAAAAESAAAAGTSAAEAIAAAQAASASATLAGASAAAAAISAAAAAASAASIIGASSACNIVMTGNTTSTTITTGGTYVKILGATTTAISQNFSSSSSPANRMVYTGTNNTNLSITYNANFSPSGIPIYVTIYKNGVAASSYVAPMSVTPGPIGGSVSMTVIIPAVTNDYFEAYATTATNSTAVTVTDSNFTARNIY